MLRYVPCMQSVVVHCAIKSIEKFILVLWWKTKIKSVSLECCKHLISTTPKIPKTESPRPSIMVQVHMHEYTQAHSRLDTQKGVASHRHLEQDVRLVSPGARFHSLICSTPCATVTDDFMKPGPAWRETCSTCTSEKAIMAEIIFTLRGRTHTRVQHKCRLSHVFLCHPWFLDAAGSLTGLNSASGD